MKTEVARFLKNPIVVIVPIVAMLLLGWNYYVQVSRNLAMASQNLLPSGSFDRINNDLPAGWKVKAHGQLSHTTKPIKGYVDDNGYQLSVTSYQNGDVTLETPRVSVKSNKNYLFKGFYKTSADFDLLARYYYKNGDERLNFVRHYQKSDDPWSTVSATFGTGSDITAVQFVYRLSEVGNLSLDNTFLEQRTNIAIKSAPKNPTNLVPNPTLVQGDNGKPQQWLTYSGGDNKSEFHFVQERNMRYLQTKVTDYKNGEAKWQYEPQPVAPGQYWQLAFDYQSNTTADIVAEFEMANGKRQFVTPANIGPAGEWTRHSAHVEVPPGAKNMFISPILYSNGTLNTDNYELLNLTRTGAPQFQRPLISITLDDAWQSQFVNGARLLDAQNLKATFYMNSGTIDTTSFMTQAQLKTLHKNKHQLAAHGNQHVDMSTLDGNRLDSEFRKPRDFLQQMFQIKQVDFAPPFGKTDPEIEQVAKQFFRSLRTTESGLNTRQNFDPYNLRVLFIDKDTPTARLTEALDEAKTYKGWLILLYHRIEDDSKTPAGVSPQTFEEHLKLVKQSGIEVKTVDSALNELRAR